MTSPPVVDDEDIETGDVDDTPDRDETDEQVDSNIGFETDFGKPVLLLLLQLVYAEDDDVDEPPEWSDKFSLVLIGAAFGFTVSWFDPDDVFSPVLLTRGESSIKDNVFFKSSNVNEQLPSFGVPGAPIGLVAGC